MNNYEAVIGLEIHIQINKTESKMFGTASNDIWQAEPNSKVGPLELGLPGTLPVPNKQAIRLIQRFGKALHCELATESKFDRKNYFYPDLPKGYQISQFDQPFCGKGYLDITVPETNEELTINIRRIHLEEDTGKSVHANGKTKLDFNKAGTPLIELVTEPDFRTPEQASAFGKMIQEAARIVGASDADMEKGHLRLEANISVRKIGETELPDYRVEVKNINSFKFMRDAINYEVDRQIKALENGETLVQETRGWNENENKTFVQRRKENAHDYRYFPEPDIPPMVFTEEYFQEVLQDLPEMPWDKEQTLVENDIREDYAKTLAYDTEKFAIYQSLRDGGDLENNELAKIAVNAPNLETAQKELEKQIKKAQQPTLEEKEVRDIVKQVIASNPDAVEDYNKGQENAVKFLFGQVMRQTKGQADPQTTIPMIKEELE